jgi:predicted nuclease with TOPRIM domain
MALEKSNSEYQKYREKVKKLQKEQSLKEIEEDIKKLSAKKW